MDDRLERFRCRRCGNCCRWPGYVRLDGEEIGALAAELRRQLPVVEFRFTDPDGRTSGADGAF